MNLTSRCPQRSRMSEGEDAGIKTAIQKAMCDKNVTPFSTYLQSVTCGSQLIKLSVIQELRFFLQEKCHASEYVVRTECVLLFLEYMKTVSCESENWDAVTRDLITMSTLCFLNGLLVYKKDENKEDLVVKIVHALSDLMSVSPKVSVGIAQVLSSVLLRVFVQENLSFMIRKNFLSTLAHMITMCTMQIRHVVLCKHMPELRNLSDFMITCGDYELQSTILEIILQLLLAAGNENEFSKSLFPSYPAISDAFVSHSFENLRSELRQFLNKVNTLSERKLVYSVPCVAAFSNNKELRKPDECNEFWVDVCISSKCLYINHQEDTARPCNLTHISEKDVKQIISAECNYVVNSKGVQCTRLDVYDNNYDLLKIYFPKTELFICLQKDVLTRLFGKKYRDVGAVATDNTPFTKMNNTVQNDSPDEIDSPPQQIQSNKKDKSKFVRSIRKNCNENNRPTSTAAFDNNNKKSRILENKNTNLQSEPDVGLIRRRKSYSSEDNSCINESNNVNNKSGNNNNNGGNEETKKVDRSNDLLNIMPAITKKRGYNKVVNGKLCPLKASLHSKDTELSKAQNCGRTPRNSLEKRKLYSFQNEDYIFSSVEEYTASLPNFYKNKEKKNDVNSKVTYSYRANKSVENKIQQEDMIFSDMLESRYKTLSLTNTPKHFPVKINVPKNNKLKKQMPIELDNDSSDEKRFFKSNKFASAVAAWNRTPIKKSKKSENTKSVYSDLSSSETDTIHVIAPFNTYSRKPISRQKITKSPKRKIVHIDSDSDSDSNYKPLSSYLNIKSVERCTRQRHKQSSVVELVNREHEYDRLRECNEAECSEELPLCGYMNLSNETVTAKDIQVAPMPLIPEISPTNAVYNIENDETILLKFSPSQKVKNNFVKQKNCVKKNSNVSHDGPTRRKKYIQVKSKKISRNKNAKISEESTAVASSHKVTARNSQRDARVDNVEVKSGKNSCGKNQNKNVSPKKKSSVIDQNTLFDDLTVYCDHNQLTESNMCSQDNADVHETSINNEIDNSQSSLRSSCRIKDLTHKDDLCRFGTALTKHMKMKLTGIQDELKEERNVQYSELDTVLVGELENIEKQKQKILSVAKEMETCRKVLEGAFSVQMKTCEELEKSIGNISSRKDNFLKEAKKTDMKQSSQIMESMNVFKEKMRGFVNTFIAADKKLINK